MTGYSYYTGISSVAEDCGARLSLGIVGGSNFLYMYLLLTPDKDDSTPLEES
jgi:hypothetical protein